MALSYEHTRSLVDKDLLDDPADYFGVQFNQYAEDYDADRVAEILFLLANGHLLVVTSVDSAERPYNESFIVPKYIGALLGEFGCVDVATIPGSGEQQWAGEPAYRPYHTDFNNPNTPLQGDDNANLTPSWAAAFELAGQYATEVHDIIAKRPKAKTERFGFVAVIGLATGQAALAAAFAEDNITPAEFSAGKGPEHALTVCVQPFVREGLDRYGPFRTYLSDTKSVGGVYYDEAWTTQEGLYRRSGTCIGAELPQLAETLSLLKAVRDQQRVDNLLALAGDSETVVRRRTAAVTTVVEAGQPAGTIEIAAPNRRKVGGGRLGTGGFPLPDDEPIVARRR